MKYALSVTASGAFAFGGVSSGSAYNVTVSTPPKGQICTVTNGSGTASANVTNVSVSCSEDPASFYVAFANTPLPGGREAGLYAVYSQSIGSEPIPITDQAIKLLGYALRLNVGNSGEVTAGKPETLMFTTVRIPGGDHVWAVDMRGTSNLVPRQVSNLTFSFLPAGYCRFFQALEDLKDPNSAFVIFGMPTSTTGCGGAFSPRNVLVRLSDTANTTPAELPPISGILYPIYQPGGRLAGLLAVDSLGNLKFYSDTTFTNPRVLLTGVSGFLTYVAHNVSPLMSLSATPSFVLAEIHMQDGSTALYRIDHTGTLSANLYDFQGQYGYGFSSDAFNLYLTDTLINLDVTQHIVQVPLDGTSRGQVLYTHHQPLTGGGPLGLIGSIGNKLVLDGSLNFDPISGAWSRDLMTLDVGISSSPSIIASFASSFYARLFEGRICVTLNDYSQTTRARYSSSILTVDGLTVQPITPHSAFISLDDPDGPSTVLQVRDIPQETLMGGGTISKVSFTQGGQPQLVQLKSPNGATFTLPPESDFTFAYRATSNLAIGGATDAVKNFGLVFDLAQGYAQPIRIDGFNVRFPAAPF